MYFELNLIIKNIQTIIIQYNDYDYDKEKDYFSFEIENLNNFVYNTHF